MDEKLLTPEQVAQILQVHQFTVLKFIKQGRLKASKIGRVYRIRQSDLELFLEQSAGRSPKTTSNQSVSDQKTKTKTNSLENLDSPQQNALEKQSTTEIKIEAVKPVKKDQVVNTKGGDDYFYILD